MHWLRWLFFLICAWSITSAWAEDKAAIGTSRSNIYLFSLGLVAVLALAFEVRDMAKARVRQRK